MVTIERKGSENPAKSGATGVEQSNLGQAPRLRHHFFLFGMKISRAGPTCKNSLCGLLNISRAMANTTHIRVQALNERECSKKPGLRLCLDGSFASRFTSPENAVDAIFHISLVRKAGGMVTRVIAVYNLGRKDRNYGVCMFNLWKKTNDWA